MAERLPESLDSQSSNANRELLAIAGTLVVLVTERVVFGDQPSLVEQGAVIATELATFALAWKGANRLNPFRS